MVHEIANSFDENLKSLIILAVASHHTPLHPELYDDVNDSLTLRVEDEPRFENIIHQLEEKIGLQSSDLSKSYSKECQEVLTKAKTGYDYSSVGEGIRLRELFVSIQGILNFSDWLASGQPPLPSLGLSEVNLVTPYYYQRAAKEVAGNAFITLPTGSGKTETALWWILGNLVEDFRVFYTLPTTTTINAMFQRIKDKKRYGLDDSVVSEYFSNVDLYLTLEGQNPTRANLNLYKNFFYPLNITTPDQLILGLMNHGRYTLKSFSMKRSLVVFDEIHAYDSETFGLIKSLIKHLHHHYHAKFCIMSATFPNVLKNELSFLNAHELIRKKTLESEYRKRKRTAIDVNFINSHVVDDLHDVVRLYGEGKKILIVMNTVARAQNIFNILRGLIEQNNFPRDDIMLIHSRFTFFDRRALERRIFDYPKILVATQVIEVSLDIDYDVLFTEACYLDSLVQRSGRINRRGRLGNNGEGIVRVFRPEGSLPYISRMLDDSIRILAEEAHTISSELDYVRLTNQFYDESWESSAEAEDRFERIWQRLFYINRANLSEEDMRDLLRTRSGLITVNSYSRTHWDEVFELDGELNSTTDLQKRAEIQRRIRMYSINVPIVYSITFTPMVGHGDNEYTVVNADYDSNLGLLIDTDVI